MAKNKSVFGIYLTRNEVDSAVSALRDAGLSRSDISVVLPGKPKLPGVGNR